MKELSGNVNKPKISIVIFFFDERDLKHCLDSVVNQSSDDLEIICTNMGSTKPLTSFGKHRIIAIPREDYPKEAVKKVFEYATGEYIHILDAQVWVDPNVYPQWYAIAKDKDADICQCLCKYHDANLNAPTREKSIYNKYITVNSLSWHTKELIFSNYEPWNKLYKKELLLSQTSPFEESHDPIGGRRVVSIKEWWLNRMVAEDSFIDAGNINLDYYLRLHQAIWDLFEKTYEEVKQTVAKNSLEKLLSLYRMVKNSCHEKQVRENLSNFFMSRDISGIVGYLDEVFIKDYLEIIQSSVRETTHSPVTGAVIKIYENKCAADRRQVQVAIEQRKQAVDKYNKITNSKSYKLGRLMSSPYRKIKGGIRCYRDHGAIYTLNHGWQKLTGETSKQRQVRQSDKPKNLGLSEAARNPKIIVSLTSFPPRINFVPKTIVTLLSQSFKPDKLLLWLSSEEFPNKEKELPQELLDLRKCGLEIRWCENLKSYKKLIPTLRAYPEDIIVTADDDAYYNKDWLQFLVEDYERNKDFGSYVYCHRITKFFKPDDCWHTIIASRDSYPIPTYLHKLVGIGGVLYPPHSLSSDVLNKELFMSLAPTSDDIWFWFMAILAGRRIKTVEHANPIVKNIEGSQEVSLWKINDFGENLFWRDFYRMCNAYPLVNSLLDKEYQLMKRIDKAYSIPNEIKSEKYLEKLCEQDRIAEKVLRYYKQTHRILDLENLGTYI